VAETGSPRHLIGLRLPETIERTLAALGQEAS
jgi:hypothetical protein